MYSRTQFGRKCFNPFFFAFVIMLFLHFFYSLPPPPLPLLYIFMVYIILLLSFIFMCMQILCSLLFLIMTEVRLKRREFFPIIFISICFKKPLPIEV